MEINERKNAAEVLSNQKKERRGRADRTNTIGIHINKNYKGWGQPVGTFSLNRRSEGEAWNYGNSVFSVSISKHPLCKSRGDMGGKDIHNHTGNIFIGCFQVIFASLHVHKQNTFVPSNSTSVFKLMLESSTTPCMLHENEFINIYSGSNILWWPLKAGDVAYDSNIRDLSEYTDLSLRQCMHTLDD